MDNCTSLYVVIRHLTDYRRWLRGVEPPDGWRLVGEQEKVCIGGSYRFYAYDNNGNLIAALMSLQRL